MEIVRLETSGQQGPKRRENIFEATERRQREQAAVDSDYAERLRVQKSCPVSIVQDTGGD